MRPFGSVLSIEAESEVYNATRYGTPSLQPRMMMAKNAL
jgi:hypothetical protein